MCRFFGDNNIISTNQYRFTKAYDSSQAILKLLYAEVIEAFNNKSYVAVIFLDFSKAFNTIKNLWIYVVKGLAHKLCSSYLSNSRQYVEVYDHVPEKKICNCRRITRKLS